ncbi:hypothetical protein JMJ77_0007160 [Colletotrichum scovillei]|uniref:Uncharacterized protein n=1 Tax=Colletotrichum scovillei TaxID=1209932 RepID=A0A9P7UFK5_9PEZI|nr:hypothetical protein JMJ77_0007160 [Colletotrichum scovillei]KAG7074126.1 hypothetical protein JMJ76_0010613 [Colletotrichum scovillei]KAG7081503.1 hypothetical protein JMJ78_0003622 [Colletotrichum scovillei]
MKGEHGPLPCLSCLARLKGDDLSITQGRGQVWGLPTHYGVKCCLYTYLAFSDFHLSTYTTDQVAS